MDKSVIIAIIIAVVVLAVIIVFRDRITELSFNGKETEVKAKMETKSKTLAEQDEKPVSVEFKGNKIRGTGEYRMKDAKFSKNDVDGKNKIELGYDDIPKDAPEKDNP